MRAIMMLGVDAHGYLDSLVHFGQKFGLETISALCRELGSPEGSSPALLIAGTNGKGSVTAYLDHALAAGALVVGRYTSPHLVRVNERIRVGGRDVRDDELEEDLLAVRRAAEELLRRGTITAPPTYFEALTAAAFQRFRTARVDVAVLEVGMGGRLDATNVADPLVSAIVSIDFDHESYLGHSLPAIAREKAGVMRAGRATVLGPLPVDAREAIRQEAGSKNARLVEAPENARWREGTQGLDLLTAAGTYCDLRPLPGQHQRDNMLVAVRVLEEARAAGLPIDLGRVASGLQRTEWPGRLQWIEGSPRLLLDGAHNAAGARALAAYLAGIGPFVLVFGALKEKAFPEMARTLFPLATEVVVTQAATSRAAAPEEILAAVPDLQAKSTIIPVPADAVRAARERARARSGSVVVAGSLYLVGDVLKPLV